MLPAAAGSPDLLPLLLQPADSDLLKGCVPQQAQQAQQGTERSEAAAAAAAGRQGREPSRGKGSAGTGPAAPAAEAVAGKGEAAAGEPAAANISCWGALQVRRSGCSLTMVLPQVPRLLLLPRCAKRIALHLSCTRPCVYALHFSGALPFTFRLQALRLQADIFRRNAEQLAAEGNEEDLQLVGGRPGGQARPRRATSKLDLCSCHSSRSGSRHLAKLVNGLHGWSSVA